MKSEELKQLQTPLKEQYKKDPNSAVVILKAQGELGDHISCKVDTGRALIEAGLHPASGGTGKLACSGDLLLEALVACAGVTLQAVATSIGFELSGGKIMAEGALDFRGTLGVSKEASVGFTSIKLKFLLNTNASPESIATLHKLTERYCVVFQTLSKGVEIKSEMSLLV